MKLKLDINELKQFSNIEMLARQLVEGFITGLHKSPYHGFSVEFAEHQLYNSGESTRHIDWKVFAKTDRLYTKRYEEETNLRCYIVLDTSSSMYYPKPSNDKIKYSILSSAALAFLMQKQRDAVGLFTFSDHIDFQSEIRSTSKHVHNLLLNLQRLFDEEQKESKSSVAQTLHDIAGKIPRRSLVILFSDMLDSDPEKQNEVFRGLQNLKHNKHEVIMFHVNDKKTELEFDFEDRPHKFQDAETGEIIKLTPTDIKESYYEQMNTHYKELYLKCHQLKIDFIDADISLGFENILESYLIKRSKMN
ncbi:DUF58 domain-containing protein [Reichenbachiella versicolor]|uniref:DUF58 domain-containing protein n=1 Tax=Reichenbachiella versicolor TaxID=1821036 RepID=UPI000D6E7A36|nr:DUF58 domain-containing protein [Reichenbachiella versicolor]